MTPNLCKVFRPECGRFSTASLSKTAHFEFHSQDGGVVVRPSVVWTTDNRSVSTQNAAPDGGFAVSDSNYDRKRELECLRLASDLVQLAADTINPHLKAHCLRMAKAWSGEAEKNPAEYARTENRRPQSLLLH